MADAQTCEIAATLAAFDIGSWDHANEDCVFSVEFAFWIAKQQHSCLIWQHLLNTKNGFI